MLAKLWSEFSGRGAGVLLGMLVGAVISWFVTRWKLVHQRRSVLEGDARDTVVIVHHLVERMPVSATDGKPAGVRPGVLRLRSLGQSELNRVVPNGYLESVLMRRAFEVTHRHTLISMEGAEGSYLLETLTNFVCDRIASGPFEHDLYVMAPCCEPAGFAQHQPITILLIAVKDLELFGEWRACRSIEVEHGTDGARILTLMELARRFHMEQAELARLRQAGQRTCHVETMYILDLALDTRSAVIPTKPVPWGRFEHILKEMNLE